MSAKVKGKAKAARRNFKRSRAAQTLINQHPQPFSSQHPIQSTENPYRVLLESIQECAAFLDKNGNILFCNRSFDAWLRLSVDDNGKGFDSANLAEPSENGGIGLHSMQQRVDSSGGIFSISSRLGNGTTVRAEWKMDRYIYPELP